MWRKVYKVCFYILFVLMLLAVVAASVICFVYGSQFGKNEYLLYGVLTLIGGTVFAFVTFAFNGMILEAADNIAAVRDAVAPKKSRRNARPAAPAVNQPAAPAPQYAPAPQVVPVPQPAAHEAAEQVREAEAEVRKAEEEIRKEEDDIRKAEEEVRETVVETRQAAAENEAVLRDSPLYVGDKPAE